MILRRLRQRRAEQIAAAEKATERTKRLRYAMSPLLEEAHQVTEWAERRIEQNHLAELFMQGRR
jgi:hypothetical protein